MRYKRKVGGLGPTVFPTGDLKADLEKIREFYKDISGKHPRQMGEVELRERGPSPPSPSWEDALEPALGLLIVQLSLLPERYERQLLWLLRVGAEPHVQLRVAHVARLACLGYRLRDYLLSRLNFSA